jgi:ParB family chromosome partitioning protein
MSPRKSTKKSMYIEAQGIPEEKIEMDVNSPEIAPVAEKVRNAGGHIIGAFHEPLAGHPLLMASLPLDSVTPAPFERDLSPTHTGKLAETMEGIGSFLDPILVVPGNDGQFWSPNGGHRLAAAKLLHLKQITSLISPDQELAFRILALNTEKAPNLKDRALEVIRMATELSNRHPDSKEIDFVTDFEAPELLTLGILYEQDKSFSGGAYRSLLKKVDRFSPERLSDSLRERHERAERIKEIDNEVKRIVEELEGRGFKSPYLRTYVVARINPLHSFRSRKKNVEVMNMDEALEKMLDEAKRFDVGSVKRSDLALTAALAQSESGE